MQVKEVMSQDVLSVSSDATVLEAATLFANTRVSAMPVLDGAGVMIGIVSEADLVRATFGAAREVTDGKLAELTADKRAQIAYEFARKCPVDKVMSRDVVTIDEDALLLDAVELMEVRKIKRLPVVRGQSVVGIVSRADLVQGIVSLAVSLGGGPRPQERAEPIADHGLRGQVIAALQGHEWSLAERVDVVVAADVVHLWGVSPSSEVRESYGKAAKTVAGVREVRNHMHVGARRDRSVR